MNDTTLLIYGAITSLPATLAALFGYLNNRAAERTERHTVATNVAIEKLEKNTNGIQSALLKVTGEAEFAKGKLENSELPQVIKRQEL